MSGPRISPMSVVSPTTPKPKGNGFSIAMIVILSVVIVALIIVIIISAYKNTNCSGGGSSGSGSGGGPPALSSFRAGRRRQKVADRMVGQGKKEAMKMGGGGSAEQPPAASHPDLMSSLPSIQSSSVFDTTMAAAAGKPVIIIFYAPSCHHCVKLAPAAEKAAGMSRAVADVYKCSATTGSDLMKRFGITGFPTIYKFLKDGAMQMYKGNRTAEDLGRFFRGEMDMSGSAGSQPAAAATAPPSTESKVSQLDDILFQDVIMKGGQNGVVMIWSETCPHSLNAIEPFKMASRTSTVPFYEMEAKLCPGFLQNYQIAGFPTVLSFNPMLRNLTPYVLTAPITAESLMDFAQSALQ